MASVFKPEDVVNLQAGDTIVMRGRNRSILAMEVFQDYEDLHLINKLMFKLVTKLGARYTKNESMMVGRLLEYTYEGIPEGEFALRHLISDYIFVAVPYETVVKNPDVRYFRLA